LLGAQGGDGVLLVKGKVVGLYNTAAVSAGRKPGAVVRVRPVLHER
jgi:hypothetical protein